jgi:hypothetical protein
MMNALATVRVVNRVVPRAQLDDEVAALCKQLLDKFPECTRYTKQQVNYWKEAAWHATVGHARDWLSTHFTTLEPYEGMQAFVENRQVDFIGLRQKAVDDAAGSEFVWGPYEKACARCGAKGIPRQFDFCGGCGATNDLTCDHSPEAWARQAEGKVIRLRDVRVLCGPCNVAAGSSRRPEGLGTRAIDVSTVTIKSRFAIIPAVSAKS